ncbi:hypothetical protein HUJ04_007216 [Dendroctonus ponderosae]|nr:hypothetical protein HUJ04_007216 [Dendroctonus ponderosae]
MKSKSIVPQTKLEDQIDSLWKDYSLDAPRVPNPIPSHTQGLRRTCIVVHLVLPLTKIIFGLRYMYECPTNAWLPYYMLVGGLLQLAFIGTLAYKPLRKPALLGAVGLAALVWMLIAAEYIICTVLLLYICTQFAYSKENDITWQVV